MGLKILPPHILKRMTPADRAPLGKAGLTPDEASTKLAVRQEKDLHRLIELELRRRSLFYSHARMDKRSTIAVGMPDFLIILPGSHALAIEVKIRGGELSADQQKVFDDYWLQTEGVVYIVWTYDEFLDVLNKHHRIA